MFYGLAQTSAFGNGDAVGQHESPIGLRSEEIHHDGHGVADAACMFGNVGAEEGFGDDLESEIHHVGVNVARFTGLPSCEHRCGGLGHDLRIGDDVFVAEGRLDEFSLRLPELAFAGEQAVAEDGAEGAVVARLEEICLVLDEDFLDAVGMDDEADGDVEETEEDDIAIFAGAAGEEAAPVAAHGEGVAEEFQAAGAGREAVSRACCCVGQGVGHHSNSIRRGGAGKGWSDRVRGIANVAERA